MAESASTNTDENTSSTSQNELQFITLKQTSPEVENLSDDEKAALLESRTTLGSETGYLMWFSPLKYANLKPADIEPLAGDAYPTPRSALNSLPAHLRASLNTQGYIQFFARYDHEQKSFNDIRQRRDDTDLLDEMLDLMSRFNLSETVVFDYIAVKDDNGYSPETIAEVRGVQSKTVKTNVDKVRSTIFDSGQDES